jgi:catechol 2,3-dioxygenase-like lactoylglutathione lyase family enzyme
MDRPVLFQRLQVALGVRNVDRSVAFYRRHLGLEVLSKMGDDFALLGRDGVTLALVLASTPAVASFAGCYLYVSDVDALHSECERANVTMTSALTTHPWGTRDFVIRDPDGHQIAIGESGKKAVD